MASLSCGSASCRSLVYVSVLVPQGVVSIPFPSEPVRALRLVRLACTWFAVPGYGTGVEGSAAGPAAARLHGFPAVLTSFVGREQAVREVARACWSSTGW